jgi:hypothetical protein
MADKPKTESKTENKPAGSALASGKGKAKDRPRVLLMNRGGGIYTCSRHEAIKGRAAGTGVASTKETKVVVFPGVNLIKGEEYDAVKDNHGFARRLAKREIVAEARAWKDIDEATCIETVGKSANLWTLAELLETEEREAVAQAIEHALDVATRQVRKEKPHLTAIQIARKGLK